MRVTISCDRPTPTANDTLGTRKKVSPPHSPPIITKPQLFVNCIILLLCRVNCYSTQSCLLSWQSANEFTKVTALSTSSYFSNGTSVNGTSSRDLQRRCRQRDGPRIGLRATAPRALSLCWIRERTALLLRRATTRVIFQGFANFDNTVRDRSI
jgi:hypothetical protein